MASDVIEQLVDAGHAAPSADNTQPWRFSWDGNELGIHYRHTNGQGHSPDPTNIATLLAIGGCLEHLEQMATALALDFDTRVDIKGDPAAPQYAGMYINQAADTAADSSNPGQHPLYSRHTNRQAYSAEALPTSVSGELLAMSQASARLQILATTPPIRELADLVKQASAVRFQVREAHEWLASSLRFSAQDAARGDGMDVRTLRLPPGGRQFLSFTSNWKIMSVLNKLGAYRFMAGIDAALVYQAPALVAISAAATSLGAIDAGRLMSRVWIALNERGLAVHPYYVIPDQLDRMRSAGLPPALIAPVQDIDRRCSGLLGLADSESLYMLLRVGYPRKPAIRSRRLNVDELLVDSSPD